MARRLGGVRWPSVAAEAKVGRCCRRFRVAAHWRLARMCDWSSAGWSLAGGPLVLGGSARRAAAPCARGARC